MNDTTALYRHFGADGALLYVGISLSWPMRTKAHASGSHWFGDVAEVKIERFATRQEALEAEREAIKRERPRFNVIYNRDRPPPKQKAGSRKSVGPLGYIAGPVALVGPALVYRDNTISVLVAWGVLGTAGELTEIVLGERAPDVPDWTDACASVLVVCEAGEITMSEARNMRMKIIRELASRLSKVDVFDTDLALAKAYAGRFPSAKSRQVLAEVAGIQA